MRPKRAFMAQGYENQQPYDEQYEDQPYYQEYEEQPQQPRHSVKPPSQPKPDPYLTMAAAVTSLVSKLDHLKD
jgi:cell division protein FtsN